MEKYFAMQFKDAGSGDTMTREELWTAIVDARKKNPVKEEVEESKKMTSAQKREFDKLYKKMDGGKEHQAIKQKIKNPVKADDAFHSLVMKKVLGEDNILDTYRQMWEDGQKYAPKLDLPEQDLKEKLSATDLKFIDMMYDKKGKLTDVGKAVMNYKPGDNIRKIVQNLNNKK